MKLLKPGWVTHDGYPIFSLDIHPDGSRFATGGQGAGDSGRVVIWNMGPIFDEEQETKENIPKFLSRMDNHLNCVNCVRWSSDGKFLASAGDDKVIMIWQIARYNSSAAGNSLFGGSSNAETWRCVATLRGHSGDILDLNWSRTDNWLASCSVDNSVIVWNTLKWNEIVVKLTGHTGLVKGVSFDPVGKYLASQSDDKSLKIWRTSDWREDATLTEPFTECGGTTHVLRLNWSPDGQHLVSAHAMNNLGSVAQIIEREGWSADKDYVGHRKAVTCVRFNQNLLKRKTQRKGEKEKEVIFSCLAIGSRDRALSVWLTSATRPLLVLHDLFDNSVLDLSWSSCGKRLLACSWDGTVACIEFEDQELGIRLSETETTTYMEKLYGKSIKSSNSSNNLLAEDVEFMKAREENLAAKSAPQTNGHSVSVMDIDNRSMNDSRSSTSSRLLKGPTDKQIEVKMTNGKRRITPLYIPPPTDLEGIPIPFNSQATTFSSSEESKSKIRVEKIDSNLSPAKNENSIIQPETSSQPVVLPTPTAATPTRTEEPVAKSSVSKSEKSRSETIEVSRKSSGTKEHKKKTEKNRPTPSSSQTQKVSVVAATETPTPRKEGTSNRHDERKRFFLTPLSIEKTATFRVNGSQFRNHEIEVENRVHNSQLHALRLNRTDTGEKLWEVIVSSKIMTVCASDIQTAIACNDNSVSVFVTSTGRLLHLPIVLEAPVSMIVNSSDHLLVISSEALLSLWNMNKRVPLVRNESLRPLFNDNNSTTRSDLHITSATVNSNGTPVISMSNRKVFTFDLNLKCWSPIASSSDLIAICSDVKHPIGAKNEPETYPLTSVQQAHRNCRHSASVFQTNSNVQANATISFLDQQLAAAFVLGSAAEYKHWLLTLTQSLTDAGREDRLKELCTFLLGPVFADPSSWDSQILGLKKRDLLDQILVIMTSNLKLQRLYSEFREQLKTLEREVSVEPMITDPATDTTSSYPSAQIHPLSPQSLITPIVDGMTAGR